MIPTETIEKALAGTHPQGSALTALELGKQLQKHRRRSDRPYSASTITTYKNTPEAQSPEFVDAFWSWFSARSLRQEQFSRVKFNGLAVDELLDEQGRIQLLGEGPVRLLVGIASLPEHTLIQTNDEYVQAVESTAPIITCAACGISVVQRSWNQKKCQKCGGKRRGRRVSRR